MREEEYRRLLIKASEYTAKAERSPHEVRGKLKKWATEEMREEVVASLLEELSREKFIDALRYAEIYVRDKIRFLHKGPHLLRQELYHKGIDEQIVEQVLSSVDQDVWLETLLVYLKPKVEGYKKKARNSYHLRQKLIQASLGRGFTMEVIEKGLSRLPFSVFEEPCDEWYDE